MNEQEKALAYLREQFGEGWQVEVDASGDGFVALAMRRGVQVSCAGWDPMSAARACVEAWQQATAPLRAGDSFYKLTVKQRDAAWLEADRLAEALRKRKRTKERGPWHHGWKCPAEDEGSDNAACTCGAWAEIDAEAALLADHDARRPKAEDGADARRGKEGA